MTQPVRAFVVASLVAAAAAHADFIVDQSNVGLSPSTLALAIGGDSHQRLAQTFTVGSTGLLAKVRLPLACSDGTLWIDVVEQSISGLPEGPLLRRTTVPAESIRAELPTPRTLIDIFLPVPLEVTVGDRLALVLTNETGSCDLARGVAGETYGGGEGYFESLPNPPGWVDIDFGGSLPGEPSDLAFQTLMEVDGSGSPPCNVWGVPSDDPLPIPADLPICRCLRDQGLREFRCTLLSSDFFAIRRIPWPLELDESYTETWEVLSLTEFVSVLDLDLERFGAGNPIELSFSGKKKSLDIRKVDWPAITKAFDVPGSARFTYGKHSWTIDTTIPAAQFDPQ